MNSEGEKPKRIRMRLPKAEVSNKKGWSIFWLIPLAAAGLAVWLICREFVSSGEKIRIVFEDGSGLEAGKSPLKFRGVEVGMVDGLEISGDRRNCIVTAALEKDYRNLACEGTRFWVVRPHISGQGVQGLGTLISQNYIQLQLGEGGQLKKEFTGLEQPPVVSPMVENRGLKVKLLAPKRWGLRPGAGVYYRGMAVGTVLDSQLGPKADTVAIEALIEEPYLPLVRVNSKFWKSGGLDVSAGLFSGLDVKVNDLRNLLEGGVEFATPTESGPAAGQNAVFRLYSEPEKEWEEWRPEISIEKVESPPVLDEKQAVDRHE